MTCWKEKFGDCCCECRYRHPLFSHPSVDNKPMSNQDGWICLPPEFEGEAIKTTEHGLCEMFKRTTEEGK